MAFTGTPTVKAVSDSRVRITGLVLAAAAAGTIGLHGDTGADAQLPATFQPTAEEFAGAVVSIADKVQAEAAVATATSAVNDSIRISKGGTPFRITLTNDGSAACPAMEMYVRSV